MQELPEFNLRTMDWRAWWQGAREWALPRLDDSLVLLLAVLALLVGTRWFMRRLDNRMAKHVTTTVDQLLLLMAARCLYLSIGFWGLRRLAGIWGLEQASGLILAAWIVAFAVPVCRFAAAALKALEARIASGTGGRLDDTAMPWLNRTVQFSIIGVAAITALHEIGINITPLLAGASVAGLAFSFAAKDTLANVISGVLLVLDRPFQIGDRIELWGVPPDQASWGDVVEIGLRATRIRTEDNLTVIIPNSVITQRDIVNWTAGDASVCLRIPVGIAYGAQADKARELMLRVAGEYAGALREPAPEALVRRFGASSVDYELRVWIRDARERHTAYDRILDGVKRAFDAEGIEIPYPQQDLHIKSMPGSPPRPGQGGEGS